MKKRFIILFLWLFLLFSAVINAQSHLVSGSPGLRIGGSSPIWFAVELRYELPLNQFFSVGTYVYYEDSFGIGIAGRWYPFSKSFFLELGSGYNMLYRSNLHLDDKTNEWLKDPEIYSGIEIIPGLGWRINVGKSGGLYIIPSVKVPVVFRWRKDIPDFYIGNIIGYLGLGYAW